MIYILLLYFYIYYIFNYYIFHYRCKMIPDKNGVKKTAKTLRRKKRQTKPNVMSFHLARIKEKG